MGYTFSPQTTYMVGTGPASVATADLNGDGKADLVTANAGSNTISIRLGNGDGTFGAETTYAVGNNPVAVTIADVNRDGRPDIITADRDDAAVSVLLGLAGGGFAHTAFADFPNPVAVATADIDGDGTLDIVVANGKYLTHSDLGVVSVLPGNGNGFFTSPYATQGGLTPSAVAVADFDHDGKSEMVVANAGDNTVMVISYFPQFCSTFVSQTYAAGAGPSGVTVADVNGDGHGDIIVANLDDDTVSVLLGDGSALGFGAQAAFAAGDGPTSVAAVDVNHDGKRDLIVTDSASGSVALLLGNGDGTFAAPTTFSTGGDPSDVAVADVNGDGRRDLIVSNRAGDTVSVLLGADIFAATGVGTSPTAPATLKIGATLALTVATEQPVDGVTPGPGGATPTLTLSNGAIATYTGFDAAGLHFSYTVQAGHGEDTGDLQVTSLALNGAQVNHAGTTAFAPQVTYAAGSQPHAVATADLNGDGLADLVVANEGSGTVSVLFNQGDGTFGGSTSYATGTQPVAVTVAHLDARVQVDLVVANMGSDSVTVLANRGDGVLFAHTHAVGDGPTSVTTADVNKDGIADIVTANGNAGTVSVLLGYGFSTLFQAQQTFAVGSGPQSVTTADVNHDGWLDIVTANRDDNTVSVLLGTGGGCSLFGAQQVFALGATTGPLSVATADLNGDGWADLVTANSGNGSVTVLLGSGASGLFGAPTTYGAGGTLPQSVKVADVNGDGALDLVVATADSNAVSVLLGPGDGTFGTAKTFAVGLFPASVDVADVNGDLKLDLITANQTSGTVSVLLNDPVFPASLDAGSLPGAPGTDTHLMVDATAPVVGVPVKLSSIDQDSSARLITQNELISNATDAHALTATDLVIASGKGTLVDHHDGTWSYTPAAGDDTSVSFSYAVTDGANVVADAATLDILPAQQGIPVTHGTPGDDTFTAGPGGQQYDGGLGIDTIALGFKLTEATVTYQGNQVIIDGPGSHTVLTGFEIYKFTDGTVNNNDGDPLVDDLFYYTQYNDVWNAHADADAHYHQYGWREARDPDAFFSTSTYLSMNPDVKAAGTDPLVHFHQFGWNEGRAPSINFDPAAYLAANPDVKAAHIDPLTHFLQYGAQEGRQPIAFDHLLAANGFDYVYYLQHNPDVAAAHTDPFQHFETIGWKEGRNPNALFDTAGYLANYADVAAAHINPLDHYNQVGWHEGRDPSVNFDTTSYLSAYADVAAAHVNPLNHFLDHGIHEGRSPFADGVWG